MSSKRLRNAGVLTFWLLCAASPAHAQVVAQRGFVDARAAWFVQDAANDPRQLIGDALWRQEVFLKPAPWVQFAGGLDGRLNTYDQVDMESGLDVRDRGVKRPALSLRRLSATLTKGPLTIDAGKQFIRWGTADIVTPTDRFAPRDFLNVVDSQFLPVTGVRAVAEFETDRLEVAVVPWMTPSRTPLLGQRWTIVPAVAVPVTLIDVTGAPPRGVQTGVRWGHHGAGYEYALSYFDGFNTLPDVEVTPGLLPGMINVARIFPSIRSYGVDGAVPLRWFTIKAEAAYVTSPDPRTDEYVLYVAQIERQSGEWLLLGGYAGEAVTARRTDRTFSPDRGLTRAFMGRATKTVDANRSVALETAIRWNGDGAYAKAEYSQARGAHWRATIAAAWIGGAADDFLGQYRENSHLTASLRFSY